MYFLLHKIFVFAGTLGLMIGVCFAIFLRRKTYWLKVHKRCNSIAVVLLLAGILMAAAMIFQQSGEHFRGYHPAAGISAFILALTALGFGRYQFLAGSRKETIRTVHRFIGWITLLMLGLSVLTGLILAGII